MTDFDELAQQAQAARDAYQQAILDAPLEDLNSAERAALQRLSELKEQCSDACADEASHAPHRAELEAAYAQLGAISQARVEREGTGAGPLPANHSVSVSVAPASSGLGPAPAQE